jgi:hypothetical protein
VLTVRIDPTISNWKGRRTGVAKNLQQRSFFLDQIKQKQIYSYLNYLKSEEKRIYLFLTIGEQRQTKVFVPQPSWE